MMLTRGWLALGGSLLLAAGLLAQSPVGPGTAGTTTILLPASTTPDEPTQLLPAPAMAPGGAGAPGGPVTMRLDPATYFPLLGPPLSLATPLELYGRVGAALNTGRGPLADILRHGVTLEAGGRSFYYNASHTAAWTADLGVVYVYNNANGDAPVIARTGNIPIQRGGFGFGNTERVLANSTLGLRELHRTSARLALGREWYGEAPELGGLRYQYGVDVGGLWGRVHAKTVVLTRVFIPESEGPGPNDRSLGDIKDGHSGDAIKGFVFGGHFGFLLPRDGYDLLFDSRLQWGRDYFKVANGDDGVSQLSLLLGFGFRF